MKGDKHNMKAYIEPLVDLLKLENDDVLTNSLTGGDDNGAGDIFPEETA